MIVWGGKIVMVVPVCLLVFERRFFKVSAGQCFDRLVPSVFVGA